MADKSSGNKQISIFDQIDSEDHGGDSDNLEEIKENKIEEARDKILNNVSAGITNTLRDEVAWILNNYPDTRESDITLMLKYWRQFQPHIHTEKFIDPEDLYKLKKLTSIKRERARIQNEYRLFLASEETRRQRGKLSDEEKDKAVKDKPTNLSYIVYMDESGKNDDYLIVGSLWYSDIQPGWWLPFTRKIIKYKEDEEFSGEFHFSEMTRLTMPIYKGMIDIFLQDIPSFSFKLISIPTFGISDKDDAFRQLFYYLIVKGIEYENSTGRAVLPRLLTVWKDKEQEGTDQILVASLEDKITNAAGSRFNDELYINKITCVNSEKNLSIQIADLFTGSANRIINKPSPTRNHKDVFAEYFLDAIGVKTSFEMNAEAGDRAVHISLT